MEITFNITTTILFFSFVLNIILVWINDAIKKDAEAETKELKQKFEDYKKQEKEISLEKYSAAIVQNQFHEVFISNLKKSNSNWVNKISETQKAHKLNIDTLNQEIRDQIETISNLSKENSELRQKLNK